MDIVTTDERTTVEKALNSVIANGIFKRWDLDKRRSYREGVPKAHYYLYFDSQVQADERALMFDVLYEKHGYEEVVRLPVQSSLTISTGTTSQAIVPSLNAITGDKLTAFAPTTVGVPYGKLKEKEIIKQLFDLGILFDHITDMEQVARSFTNTVKKEIAYRNPDLSVEEVHLDIINTSFLLGVRGTNKALIKEYTELQKGIREFSPFLFGSSFRLDHAIVSSSKAAFLSALIRAKNYQVSLFTPDTDINTCLIEHPGYNQLNKLKKLPGGALFYWSEVVKLL